VVGVPVAKISSTAQNANAGHLNGIRSEIAQKFRPILPKFRPFPLMQSQCLPTMIRKKYVNNVSNLAATAAAEAR
jgi:hypothetical protein